MSKTVMELNLYRRFLGITVKSNVRKAELVSAMADWIIEYPVLTLKRFPLHELKLLSLLAQKGPGVSVEINRTSMTTFARGMDLIDVSVKNDHVLSLRFADGIYEALAPYIDNAIREIEMTPRAVYEQYLWGCLTIYGMITYSDLYSLIEEHFADEKNEVYKFLAFYPAVEYIDYMSFLVHPCAEAKEVLSEIEKKG